MAQKVFAVVPAYNEEKYIITTIQNILPHVEKVLVVNDGSKDNTFSLATSILNPKLIVLRHRINLGKGAALKTGCQCAKKLGADIIVTLDGDGQHPANKIPEIIRFMNEKKFDIVFTARKGGDKMPFVRALGNWAINFFAWHLYHLRVHDMWCGFRALRVSILPKIAWKKTDYSGEIEMCLKVGKNHLSYGEYIIPTIYHDTYKGMNITHGIKLLFQMLIWRFRF